MRRLRKAKFLTIKYILTYLDQDNSAASWKLETDSYKDIIDMAKTEVLRLVRSAHDAQILSFLSVCHSALMVEEHAGGKTLLHEANYPRVLRTDPGVRLHTGLPAWL